MANDDTSAMPTHEIMAFLDDVSRERFVKFQEVFETEGWKLIEEYANAQITVHGIEGSNGKTWEDVLLHRGQRLAFQVVANWHNEFMTAFEAQAQQAKEAAEAGDENAE